MTTAVNIAEALLMEEREAERIALQSDGRRLAYAAYLLRWSAKPSGNPMTYGEWSDNGYRK